VGNGRHEFSQHHQSLLPQQLTLIYHESFIGKKQLLIAFLEVLRGFFINAVMPLFIDHARTPNDIFVRPSQNGLIPPDHTHTVASTGYHLHFRYVMNVQQALDVFSWRLCRFTRPDIFAFSEPTSSHQSINRRPSVGTRDEWIVFYQGPQVASPDQNSKEGTTHVAWFIHKPFAMRVAPHSDLFHMIPS
jgi:hypothetical protein